MASFPSCGSTTYSSKCMSSSEHGRAVAAEDHTRQSGRQQCRSLMGGLQSSTFAGCIHCRGLPAGGDIAVRIRELIRACILAAPLEYHNKRYGEILNLILRVGGAVEQSNIWQQTSCDKPSSFHYIHTYLVDIEVLRHDAPTAVSEIEADKDGVRFGLDTPTIDVINDPNFYDLALW